MKEPKPVEQRVKSFAFRLKKDFGEEIRKDPSKFKARVIGTLKAVLPRNRPGKRASPLVGLAAEIYQRDFKEQGKEANWHSISTRVVPGYLDLPSNTQKLCRIQLRANVHSHLYEDRSRQRREKRMLSMVSHPVAERE